MTTPLLISDLLAQVPGIAHGFTLREGGLSTGSFESLNLGTRTTDDRNVVETNRRRVLAELGRSDGAFVALRQIHSADLVEVNHLAGRSIPADGLLTRDPMAVIAVLVADCVPILIANTSGSVVAAVHAGWRGTKQRIAAAMVERLVSLKIEPDTLRVAIGPSIGPCCFEVGDEVADELRTAYPDATDAFATNAAGRPVANLWALNHRALVSAGVAPIHIDRLDTCSKCDPRFFSHRRDGAGTGRQAGVITLVP